MKSKKFLIIVLVLIVIGIGGFLIFNHKKESPKEVPSKVTEKNKELIKDQIVENVTITNIALSTKNGKSVFSAKINNLTSDLLEIKSINILVRDKESNELITLTGYFGGVLEPEGHQTITAETPTDLSQAKTIEFSLNK